jgi:uncharacterized protein YkwD
MRLQSLYAKTSIAAGLAVFLAAFGTAADAFYPSSQTLSQRACAMRLEEALQQINAARASSRRCGGRPMSAAPPLRWDQRLHSVASGHSQDMAKRNYFDHETPEGVKISDRVSASSYKWRSVGENLAAGDRRVGDAVQGWLESPKHCENMMDPKFVDVAVACAAQPGTVYGTYWTMVLGRT